MKNIIEWVIIGIIGVVVIMALLIPTVSQVGY